MPRLPKVPMPTKNLTRAVVAKHEAAERKLPPKQYARVEKAESPALQKAEQRFGVEKGKRGKG